MSIERRGVTLAAVGFVILLAIGGATIASGCVTHTTSESEPVDAHIITEAEIDSAHLSTAYDVIHKLRPQFLMSRGKISLDPGAPPALPRVYVDNQLYGDAATLRGILTGMIAEIHYYTASEAQYKFGHDNAAGVIAVTTKH